MMDSYNVNLYGDSAVLLSFLRPSSLLPPTPVVPPFPSSTPSPTTSTAHVAPLLRNTCNVLFTRPCDLVTPPLPSPWVSLFTALLNPASHQSCHQFPDWLALGRVHLLFGLVSACFCLFQGQSSVGVLVRHRTPSCNVHGDHSSISQAVWPTCALVPGSRLFSRTAHLVRARVLSLYRFLAALRWRSPRSIAGSHSPAGWAQQRRSDLCRLRASRRSTTNHRQISHARDAGVANRPGMASGGQSGQDVQ